MSGEDQGIGTEPSLNLCRQPYNEVVLVTNPDLACSEVAIGKFLPDQPYDFSIYGGYRIELLAGGGVIAADSDTMEPDTGSFRDAFATVLSTEVLPALLGQPLAVRLTISATEEDRSTHFDFVRLMRRSLLWGDADHDSDVDLADFQLLLDCFAGPGNPPDPPSPTTAPQCLDAFDGEPDMDVDLVDVATFQTSFTGS